jgi:hypothetical protein
LAVALGQLGFTTRHHARDLFPLFPDWTVTGNWPADCDVLADMPAVLYWRELLAANPSTRVILTVRNEDAWYRSIAAHHEAIMRQDTTEDAAYALRLHQLCLGWQSPQPYWWRRHYREHNAAVQGEVPGCLVMDVAAGDGWEKLCAFLGLSIPSVEFPHANKGGGVWA